MNKDRLFKFWKKNYCSSEGHCTLCGNWGVVKTLPVYTPAGFQVITKANYCLCPNGRAISKQARNLKKRIR